MKKIVSISLVFALIAGAAFAEASVSGTVYGKVIPLYGDSGEDAKGDATILKSGGDVGRIRVEFSAESEDGTMGAWARLEPTSFGSFDTEAMAKAMEDAAKDPDFDPNDNDLDGYDFFASFLKFSGFAGNVWWQPMKQLKFLIGGNGGDGFFGADGVARWNFYGTAGDIGIVNEAWAFGDSFYKGFADDGAILFITPVDGLEINIGIPFISNSGTFGAKDEKIWSQFHAQVAYNIANIGKFALTYRSDRMDEDVIGDSSKMFAYFGLTMVQNLAIDLGLGFQFPESANKTDVNYPFFLGLGANFSTDTLGVKFRFQAQFPGSKKVNGGKEVKGDTVIIVDVLPSFKINDSITALLSAGLNITAYDSDNKWPNGDSKDPLVGFHVQPYVIVKNIFYAGFRLDTDGTKFKKGQPNYKDGDAVINWSIPIGMEFSF